MGKNKDPAVLFYTSAFLTETRLMNYAQIGKYITLLCIQHQSGHLSKEDFDSVCAGDKKVASMFVEDAEGRFYNEDMEVETLRREAYSESRSKNRKKGGGAPNIAENICLSYDATYEKHSRTRTRTKTITRNRDINNKDTIEETTANAANAELFAEMPSSFAVKNAELFEKFWLAYPKKKNKAYAKECFERLNPSPELLNKMIEAIEEQKKSSEWKEDGGRFIPHPSTWLNGARWEDEVEVAEVDEPVKYGNFSANDAMAQALKRSYGNFS